MAQDFHPLTIADVRRETPEAISIRFAVPEEMRDDFAFTSGQYLTLRTELDGAELRRSYSICSGMDEGELRVAIKRLDGGLFSSFANAQLKAGDTIDVMPPAGRFGLAPQTAAERTYVGFAAGSGITPIFSIIKTVLTREPRSHFVLFYGNKSSATIMFKDELDDLKDRFVDRLSVHHILSREMQDIDVLHGRLTGDKVPALIRTAGGIAAVDDVFLCGPLPMIEEVSATLMSLGLSSARLHQEVFTTETPPRPLRPSAPSEAREDVSLSVKLDGVLHKLAMRKDETVLEAAERHELDLPYSCRGGMCCTCRAKLIDGAGAMDQNFSLEPWEEQAGFVLTCQFRPASESIALDYDAM
ncbi:MAG TPA: 1,2-phenylacetyl-CoA epoxidase subunit PaaE [Beijerinckiaceae bacterium]|jgi:ring-1,2-phenylacetyl-CoA epoxidase subunit PaaE|nr:1,2-phenylacetyl-CoA epoxidase subunit PaaE [Beijerinckiaceae bacterium]